MNHELLDTPERYDGREEIINRQRQERIKELDEIMTIEIDGIYDSYIEYSEGEITDAIMRTMKERREKQAHHGFDPMPIPTGKEDFGA